MKIRIFNRQKAVKASYKETETDKIIISVRDPDKNRLSFNRENPSVKAVLHLAFYDIDLDEIDIYRGYEPMKKEDADRICKFVENWRDKVGEIWVNCEMGVSRSAGIAAALTEYFGESSDAIFECPDYSPNKLCYLFVKNAFDNLKKGKNVL